MPLDGKSYDAAAVRVRPRTIRARLTVAFDGGPLAVLDGMPGDGAELRPAQMRELAAALLRVAADAEARKLTHRGKPLPAELREYVMAGGA